MASKLIVRSIGSGKERAKLVVFPGHEFGIEHFLPRNFQRGKPLQSSTHVRVADSKLGEGVKFILRTKRPNRTGIGGMGIVPLDPVSEARLARFLKVQQLWGAKVEEPLAAILRPGARQEVFYHFIEPAASQEWKVKHLEQANSFFAALHKHGLRSPSVEHRGGANSIIGKDGNLHFIDLEFIEVSPEAAKKLNLKKYLIPRI